MECLVSRLGEAGVDVVPFGEPADWIVVNTCTVTTAADSDSRQLLRRAVRGRDRSARTGDRGRVVVTGCLAQRDPAGLAGVEGVDFVIGNAEKPDLGPWILEQMARGEREAEPTPTPARILVGSDPTTRAFADFGGSTEGRRSRATLKVQDGCDEHCTFCVIPSVRGQSRSRPLEDVLAQARRLVASGYAEIALTGINTALWGHDLPEEVDLLDLLAALGRVEGARRLRLNSLEPQYVTPEWLERFAASERLCRHFHFPLQSGDDAVLRRMNRRYDTERYRALVRGTVSRMPGAAIGCDVMVGFPGESEARFEGTLHFLESLPLAYLHVFTYSERPDTPAPRLRDEVPVEERKRRSSALRRLGTLLRERFAESQIGTVQTVVPETQSAPGTWQGLTGNYLRVRFPFAGDPEPGTLFTVRLDGFGEAGIVRATMLESTTPPRPPRRRARKEEVVST